MMLAFVLLAAALVAGIAVLVLFPLLRRREDAQPSAGLTASLVVLALLLGSGGLYAWISNYSWTDAAPAGDTPAARAAALAKALTKRPDDLDGWLRLGDAYTELQQFPLAARAFQRADRVANGNSGAALMGLAEARVAMNMEDIRGAAGHMFERVLELEPQNPKALFYAALAAMSRGEAAPARDRFQRILALNPRADIKAIIEKQLQALDAADQPGTQPAAAPGASDAQVRVHVTVAPSLQYQLTPEAALFVAARDPAQPGPPFAAKRLPLNFPAEVTLTAADAMLPGRHISAGQKLEVVARISLSGQPTSSSGDPFGQVNYHVGKDGTLNVVIDKLAP